MFLLYKLREKFPGAEPGIPTSREIPALQIGFLDPEFNLHTSTGDTVTLSDLRGQPVEVNLWASWCPPCQAEMPALERIYADYNTKGLVNLLTLLVAVLGVAVGIAHLAAGSAFGAPTSLPLAIELWGSWRHPTQVYETVVTVLILVAVLYFGSRVSSQK